MGSETNKFAFSVLQLTFLSDDKLPRYNRLP